MKEGDRLKEFRKVLKLTQAELCKVLQIKQTNNYWGL